MPLDKSLNLEFKPACLSTQLAEILTQAILEGKFKGGDQLVESDLQAHFGVSRSPLREALREIEKKGLVVIVPRRGTFVRRITRKDIEENFPVRAALEGLAAKLAARNMTPQGLERMGQALEGMQQAAQARDTRQFYTRHLTFHEVFIEHSANEVVMQLLKNLRMQSLWHRFSYQYYREDFEKSYRVHQEILAMFREGADPEKIRTLVETHINVALDRFIAYLAEFERD